MYLKTLPFIRILKVNIKVTSKDYFISALIEFLQVCYLYTNENKC